MPGSADHRPVDPTPRSQALTALAALARADCMVVARAAPPTAGSSAAAAPGAPAAPAADPAPAAPRAGLLLAATPPLLLLLPAAAAAAPPAAIAASPACVLLLLSSSAPRRSEARWAKASASRREKPRPPRPWGRRPSKARRRWTYSDRIPLDPRSWRLGGSLLLLGARHLDPLRRWWGGLPHQWTRRGTFDTSRRPRIGGACKHSKARSQSP